MTNLYYIENIGCDDTTHGLASMTDEEFVVFKRVVENLNKNSTYECMPTIAVYKISDSFIRQATNAIGVGTEKFRKKTDCLQSRTIKQTVIDASLVGFVSTVTT